MRSACAQARSLMLDVERRNGRAAVLCIQDSVAPAREAAAGAALCRRARAGRLAMLGPGGDGVPEGEWWEEDGSAPKTGWWEKEGAIPAPLPATEDPFALLGIDDSSAGDLGAIKRAYHRQAKTYHPDAFPKDPESTPEHITKHINNEFSRINAAYEELMSNDGNPNPTAARGPGNPSASSWTTQWYHEDSKPWGWKSSRRSLS